MDFFFVGYRDPILGLIFLAILIFIVAVGNYFWLLFANKEQEKELGHFIKKFEIQNEHKELLRASSLGFGNLCFLASVFTKSGEFEKATQIYLIALEKTKDKKEQEMVFYDLAEVYFKAGFLKRSVEVLLNTLKIRPRNFQALKLLKILYLRLRYYDEVLEVLDALFELGFQIDKEKAFVKALIIHNTTKSKDEKIDLSLKLDENNEMLQRYIFEEYKYHTYTPLENVIDLLYKNKEPIFLENEEYFEFFYALGEIKEKKDFEFKNKKFEMLNILKQNNFRSKLHFSYMCMECKNTMPIFFYHCPICYEFNQCKIFYEVKDDEKD